ncbi:MAG: metallophosphoesterase [Bacteroidales bacterium]
MSNAGRIAMFLAAVLLVWSLMHLFVLTRLWSLPLLAAPGYRRWLIAAFVCLWVSFPLAQILARGTMVGRAVAPLEVFSAFWLGTLFLLFIWLLAADVLTGFGWLLPGWVSRLRSVATVVALVFAGVGLVQGVRAPAVRSHDVTVKDLPPEHEGLVIVQITDLHLGELLGQRWLEDRVAQIDALRPDVIAMTGDLLNEVPLVEPLLPTLRRLRAPLGVYAVTGNHEFYAGLDASVRLFEDAGFRVLRNTSAQLAPGLVIAGVDDLTAGRQFSVPGHAIERALAARPAGATILLSHTPWNGEQAAGLGVGLMLSGHTHGGQIWPFVYFTRLVYPHVVGRYTIGGMTWLVSRGTGFWGPPMRLFKTAEILKITLHKG